MKAFLRIVKLFVALALFGSGILGMRGREVATIDQAIQKVQAITDPDPGRQNELRAEEAKNIIMARIRTTNPDGKVDPDLAELDEELEKLRNSSVGGEELIKWTWENRAGRCDEQVNLLKKILAATGVRVTTVTSTQNHTFLLINLAPDADPDIPWTWGPNAKAPDTWLKRTLTPEEAWEEKWYFDHGKGYVANAGDKSSTRQYIKQFNERRDRIDKQCQRYRQWLSKYFKIPEHYRKELEFRPEEDLALERAEKELEEIRRPIRRLDPNDSEYSQEVLKIHANLSDLDGRLSGLGKCCAEVESFRKKVNETFRLLPTLRADAGNTPTDDVPSDIIQHTGELKVFRVRPGQWLSTGIQLKQGQYFQISATGIVKREGDREWGPNGYYHLGFMAYTLKAMVGEQLFDIGASGGGQAPVDGELRLGITYTYTKVDPAEARLQGAFNATVTISGAR